VSLENQHDVENTRAKLKKLEERYAELQAEAPTPGREKIRDWTLLSLKKLMNQFQEEIARFESRASAS
jgi:hypothetical protein